MTLGEGLEPLDITTFLRDYVGRRHLLTKGGAGRFSRLVSWQELNDQLGRMRVDDQRVRLIKKANNIPRSEYVRTSRAGPHEYLNGPAVTAHVLDGATLVVNQVDELFPAVRRFAESCEHAFRVYVSANLYAGWRTDNGFDVHWDRHDTLIVQVIGRKNWRVWPPTRLHPLAGDSPQLVPPPSTDPVLDGVLEDGDLLYMPRGWWHVAYPRDEPSVHVTFAVAHPTGVDLLDWMVAQLREVTAVRTDAPHWTSPDEQAAWIAALRDAWTSALRPDVLSRFMASRDSDAPVRPFVDLPRGTEPLTPPLEDDLPLRLVWGRQLHFWQENGSIAFTANGTTWRFDKALVPALRLLNQVAPCTVAEMRQSLNDRGRLLLRPFVSALLKARVIWGQRHPEGSTRE